MSKEKDRTAQEPPGEREGGMSESEIDDNLRDTFPASDPPSWTLGMDHGADARDEQED